MNETRHSTWGADALWRQLEPLLPGVSVEVVARVESTNTELIERARRSGGSRAGPVTRAGGIDSGFDNIEPTPLGRRSADIQPCLLVAEHQTRGRGRLGREWQGSAGASLSYSLALPLVPVSWRGLSLAVGVALADALDPCLGGAVSRIGVKWPNDLCLIDGDGAAAGRKLGGILIETVAVGEHRMCVVGVGLNVHPQPVDNLSQGYASLDELDASTSGPSALALTVVPLAQALRTFEQAGFAAFADRFAARDLLHDRPVTTTQPACPRGVAIGVDDSGALRVRADDGSVHLISSGDVSVRLDGAR